MELIGGNGFESLEFIERVSVIIRRLEDSDTRIGNRCDGKIN